MRAVMSRVWGWVWPWSRSPVSENTTVVSAEGQKVSSQGYRGLTSWIWGARKIDQTSLVEEYWEAQEKLQPMEIEDLGPGKLETVEHAPRWWDKFHPSNYFLWPGKLQPSRVRRRKIAGWNQAAWDSDNDGEFSDYGTPPPSPTPPSSQLVSPLRLFVHSWKGEILPEHYEICFNFLRHLFDLFVVGFLWTVSPPTKLILEVLGVHGALKLWFHGMAMFFVSTVGMAGLLWLIQEYLPQFALIYGIVQALVISVSVRQSVILGEEEEKDDQDKEDEEVKDNGDHKEKLVSAKDKIMP
ncbi:uncharacterized protein C6orf47 homolog [Myripristis murdjan]|uniref:Si:ch73-25f10.6 n=1 Tax=Myripristis murdjan TaxID=586833 RepID=A0A667XDK3_9TELE|nr:uncharacterized protein C6orf47 homolog [Myripristis murdjan]XP_029919123.1 uncharacterized protein C6orf47 homolog [Myripristis murdjan]XP_029919124.1 uncharacterized protein C6orf47 homolog [Myripristis murdjan]